MENKKVLIVASVFSHIAQFHQNLINLLNQNGYIVDIVGFDNLKDKDGRVVRNIRTSYNICIRRNPINPINLKALIRLKKIIKENQYDYIHANTPIGGLLARVINLKKLSKKPKIIYTAHGFHFYKGSPLKNWLFYYPIEKILSKRTDILITINNEDFLTSHRKNFKCKIVRIHGVGVDETRFKPISREDCIVKRIDKGFYENSIIGLCIGELNDNKNQETLVRAFSELKNTIPNIRLLLAGNGPNRKKLENLVKNLGLENHIHFLGYVNGIEEFVQISDFIISSSKREGLGLNIIEGMLCKKVIIASKNRGHKELIVHLKNGYLVNNDTESFKNAIQDAIYLSSDSTEKIKQEAHTTGLKYSWDKVKSELAEIYDIAVYSNE